MEKEEKKFINPTIKNNYNQIGFTKGLGCEINILKLQ